MAYARSALSEFETANALYAGASVSFFTVDANGQITTTLAPLYADTVGASLLPNPQVLDSFGKFAVPVYIDQPVIGSITFPNDSIPSHNTGIITTPGRWRGPYATTTLY